MRECNFCRRLFSSFSGRVCRDCFKYLEEIYPTVRSFIRDSENPRLEVDEISDTLEIPVQYIQGLVDYGYINKDLPHVKSYDSYENEDKVKLAKELQQAVTDLKSNDARRKTATTYGQERYARKK